MSRFLSLLLASSLFLAVLAVSPVGAGTKLAPEITDPAHDIAVLSCISNPPVPDLCTPGGGLPTDAAGFACLGDVTAASTTNAGLGGDIVAVWVDHENSTSFQVNVQTSGDPTAGFDTAQEGSTIAAVRLTANFTAN